MTFDDMLDGLFAFGRTVRSVQATATKNVLVYIRGDRARDGSEETHDKQSMWLMSPILYRPAAPRGTEGEEALFLRRGNEAVVIGTRDLRWQVELAEGECVVRALGDNAARIRLKADGTVVVEATRIDVKAPGSQAPATLGLVTDQKLSAELNKLVTTLATGANGGGAVVFGTPYVPGTDLKSQRFKVDQ